MKFLIDMNLSPLRAPFLINEGRRLVNQKPLIRRSSISQHPIAGSFSLVTLDLGMLLAVLRTNCPSVVQVRCQDVLPSAIDDIVLRAIRTAKPHLEAGALVP